ncbi:NAD(P)/FAD-dependent oxidoreductase [Ilumatobacter sp.]|uniref:NAD(P)/FAD-dependent oxidoreductase n=1 Tax=Ilumatobacter sp. TaxID=1967498 RepID=UPI003AF6493D
MVERVVVVGNGLIGSAAGRRLAEMGHDVVVVGPAEPRDHSRHTGVFSSHYDEGRLVSAYSADPAWTWITRRAIDAFADLQARSGVAFHHPVGRLSLLASPSVAGLRSWAGRVDPSGGDLRVWSATDDAWRERFPYLEVPSDLALLHEGSPAGYVNPRRLLRAQNVVAERHGARFVGDRVVSVISRADGVTVATAGGELVAADRVIVAAGAFTNFGDLLPEPIPLRLKTETTVWAEVSDATANACASMPAITFDVDDPDLDDIYLAPPIRYPDGRCRIKMGGNTANESWPATLDEVQAWFRSGESDRDLEPMERALRKLLPGIELGDVTTHRCIVAYTPSGYPTIDGAPGDAHGRIVVATGGNGTGAQGSDTLGSLAAGLVHDGSWPDELDRSVFGARRRWEAPAARLSNAQRRARGDQSADTA